VNAYPVNRDSGMKCQVIREMHVKQACGDCPARHDSGTFALSSLKTD
jgi:hypothetical protein